MSEEEKERLMQHVDFEIPKASISSSTTTTTTTTMTTMEEKGKSKTILGKVSKKSRQFKEEKEARVDVKRARFTAASDQLEPDDVVHGWIRAMFNQMDTNGDGRYR